MGAIIVRLKKYRARAFSLVSIHWQLCEWTHRLAGVTRRHPQSCRQEAVAIVWVA